MIDKLQLICQTGRSVNRNRSVRYFGYPTNSVPTKIGIDRFLRKCGTEKFRFRVIWFGFGSYLRNRKNSKYKDDEELCTAPGGWRSGGRARCAWAWPCARRPCCRAWLKAARPRGDPGAEVVGGDRRLDYWSLERWSLELDCWNLETGVRAWWSVESLRLASAGLVPGPWWSGQWWPSRWRRLVPGGVLGSGGWCLVESWRLGVGASQLGN